MAKRFKEKLVDWQVLYDSLVPRITAMPHLAADHQALGNLLTESRDLEKGQEAARSQLRDINQRRKELGTQATELNSRLSLGLRSSLGSRSEKLIEFGVKPVPRTRRKAKGAVTTTTTETSPPSSSGQPPPKSTA